MNRKVLVIALVSVSMLLIASLGYIIYTDLIIENDQKVEEVNKEEPKDSLTDEVITQYEVEVCKDKDYVREIIKNITVSDYEDDSNYPKIKKVEKAYKKSDSIVDLVLEIETEDKRVCEIKVTELISEVDTDQIQELHLMGKGQIMIWVRKGDQIYEIIAYDLGEDSIKAKMQYSESTADFVPGSFTSFPTDDMDGFWEVLFAIVDYGGSCDGSEGCMSEAEQSLKENCKDNLYGMWKYDYYDEDFIKVEDYDWICENISE